jgi:phosphomannomutase
MNSQSINSCFKAYDIRGKVPDELDAEFCRFLALALVSEFRLGPGFTVVCGRDVRPSGLELGAALSEAFLDSGVDVADIGVCGTEEIYFAAARHGFALGIMLTASHNPAEYNGIKIVRAGAVPLSGDSGLCAVRDRMLDKNLSESSVAGRGARRGRLRRVSYKDEYAAFILSCLEPQTEKNPLKIVLNPGNGSAGTVLEKILPGLPGEFVLIHEEPDGTFPGGIPNPLLPERRADTAQAVRGQRADLGVAWDGDFDRCFFYDARAEFIESYYLIGLFAGKILAGCPGGKVLHDTRLVWNTVEQVLAAGGIPVQSKTGHAFMKESMRREQAVYGGEMSAHHYFRSFHCCDSGMLPWIVLLNILAEAGRPLAELVSERIAAYPCSGELNFKVSGEELVKEIFRALYERYATEIKNENYLDGLSADCGRWRFNLRTSNTEPLLRLNVEARGDAGLMRDKTAEISALINSLGSL